MGNDTILIEAAKNEKDERAQRADLLMHNVAAFVELGGQIPELEDLKKALKIPDKTFGVLATKAGIRLNRSKRAAMYTLSGPALSYAGLGVAGVIAGATNPFGWAVV